MKALRFCKLTFFYLRFLHSNLMDSSRKPWWWMKVDDVVCLENKKCQLDEARIGRKYIYLRHCCLSPAWSNIEQKDKLFFIYKWRDTPIFAFQNFRNRWAHTKDMRHKYVSLLNNNNTTGHCGVTYWCPHVQICLTTMEVAFIRVSQSHLSVHVRICCNQEPLIAHLTPF